MQPTTHETISESTLTGVKEAGRDASNRGLRVRVVYAFVILALCIMIADFYRLTRTHAHVPLAASSSYQSGRF